MSEESLEGTLPHRKVMDGVEEEDFYFIKQNLLEDQIRSPRILTHRPQIQPKFGQAKIVKQPT